MVQEHEFALQYRHGRYVGQLPAGRHRLWGRGVEIRRLDRRRQLLDIPAQELPTVDGVTIKVTAQVTWQIVDPKVALTRDADHRQALYALAQQAVRTVISGQELAKLTTARQDLALALQAAMTEEATAIGLVIQKAVIKDVMPNAETRKAMAAVAFARQEAQAALEKARGEQASLRALANAARLLEEHPSLARMKGLQILADGLRSAAQVVVNAGDMGLMPVYRKG